MSQPLPIVLRPANSEDIGFLFNSWLKSFRNSDFAKKIANEIYYSEHHKIIEKLFAHYDVVVACNENDLAQIYGFMCAGDTENILTIHYIYVKHTFRRMGIAKSLLKSIGHDPDKACIYTHYSYKYKSIAEKYNMIYHPYIALNPEVYKK